MSCTSHYVTLILELLAVPRAELRSSSRQAGEGYSCFPVWPNHACVARERVSEQSISVGLGWHEPAWLVFSLSDSLNHLNYLCCLIPLSFDPPHAVHLDSLSSGWVHIHVCSIRLGAGRLLWVQLCKAPSLPPSGPTFLPESLLKAGQSLICGQSICITNYEGVW